MTFENALSMTTFPIKCIDDCTQKMQRSILVTGFFIYIMLIYQYTSFGVSSQRPL